MNTAQKNLKALLPKATPREKIFLTACIQAWESYTDSQYSFPKFKLKEIEKRFNMTAYEIKNKQNQKPIKAKGNVRKMNRVNILAQAEMKARPIRNAVKAKQIQHRADLIANLKDIAIFAFLLFAGIALAFTFLLITL